MTQWTTEDAYAAYPDLKPEDDDLDPYFYGPGSYQPILDSLPGTIVLQIDDNDYQGDSRLLYRSYDYERRANVYRYLIFGWGSCSGCDSLQACSRIEDVVKLRNDLLHQQAQGLLGVDSEVRAWIKDRDWDLEWAWHADETKAFVAAAWKLMGGEGDAPPLREGEPDQG